MASFVHIESFVEIGANVTIDRGTYGVTRIGEGTKIDNLVQIAHNVTIGKRVIIASQTGISGSCTIEDDVVIGGQVGFGVNVVTGDYSQGAVGHWIENGRLTHPVHEVTIAGNLREMLRDVDAVGTDLVFRGSSASPTIRVRRMTVSGGPLSGRS